MAAVVTLVAVAAGACMARPGPPPVAEAPTTPVVAATTTATSAADSLVPQRTSVAIGVEGLRNGLNPHLVADSSAMVDAIADLTLPSAFIDGVMNADLLVSAEEVDPVAASQQQRPADETQVTASAEPTEATATTTSASPTATSTASSTVATTSRLAHPDAQAPAVQTLRYVIQPEAQWSDGTPITGNDFIYLWEAMTSTPGVINGAPYAAISAIRTSDGARTVEVDLTERVAGWQQLFDHLLPSHLVEPRGADFATAFHDDVPASGSQFMFISADRGRGQIVLHRNDRFWGAQPAKIDIVRLNRVSDDNQAVDTIRSGQAAFLDYRPGETSLSTLSLVSNAQVRLVEGPRQLQLDLNVASSVLAEMTLRQELVGYLDIPTIAVIAAGRTSHVSIPGSTATAVEPEATTTYATATTGATPTVTAEPTETAATIPGTGLQLATADRPLRIGADPADDQASAAARAVVNLLAGHGVRAEAVAVDVPTATQSELPSGRLDAMITRMPVDSSAANVASRLMCPAAADAPRSMNLSGYCGADGEKLARDALAGQLTPAQARHKLRTIAAARFVSIPLLGETRVQAYGGGIDGVPADISEWTVGLAGAARWSLSQPETTAPASSSTVPTSTKEP